MITGTHVLFYSEKPEADRVFFRDVLGLSSIDAGKGWLLFAFPPAEAGIHLTDRERLALIEGGSPLPGAEAYLMCDDLQAEITRLRAKKVICSAVETTPRGINTTFRLPSGRVLGICQPTPPTALDLKAK